MVSDFQDVSKSLMDEYLSWDPSFATQVGWHRYDHVLRDPRRTAIAHQIERCSELISTLKRIQPGSLTGEEVIDRDLAIYFLELKRYEMEELRLYERWANGCEEVGYSLFFLFSRDVPRLDDRLEAMTNRIEKIPELLTYSRELVSRPYRRWNEAALEVGNAIPELIKSVQHLGKPKDPSISSRLKKATEAAVVAVDEYNKWVSEDVLPNSSDEYAIAAHEYERMLEKKCYGVSMDEALAIGETYLKLSRSKMAALAKRVVPSGKTSDALEKMKSDHPPTFKAVLDAYRDSAQEARRFVVEHDLATLPPKENLIVMETPQFMRPMFPYAGQFEPGKFDGSRAGFFLVTPDETNPKMLREHSQAGIINTTVHEGYPGHHIQGICSNTHPSYIRILIQSPDFSEGWGLYTEDMMRANGYSDNDLGSLVILNDLVFRICRLVVEVKLAKGEMTIEEGAEMLAKECSMDLNASMTEARSCAMSPTYFCSYFIGKLGLMQLREEVKEVLGGRFSLKFFHDALLYTGCLPMPFMRRGVALRLGEQYGLDLPPQKETLYEYAMRKASGDGP
ncbi:MAG: hypothetical protein A3K76_07285 [Euryarchaeota archaeon RBG_13_57_23]|nr:MAG: hypothetical protein A3K76_07285 [Euryarchaeota archaeon RBG_13_57_23]